MRVPTPNGEDHLSKDSTRRRLDSPAKRIAITLSEEEDELFAKECEVRSISKSAAIREALRRAGYLSHESEAVNAEPVNRARFPKRKRAFVSRCRYYRAIPGVQSRAITQDDVNALIEKQNGKCFYCRHVLGGYYEVDHYIPLSKGGMHSVENLRVTCLACNRSKSALMPENFFVLRAA